MVIDSKHSTLAIVCTHVEVLVAKLWLHTSYMGSLLFEDNIFEVKQTSFEILKFSGYTV